MVIRKTQPAIPISQPVLFDLVKQFCKYITDQHQGNITGGYTDDKRKSPLMPVVQALLDDRKKNRPHCDGEQ